MKIICDRCEKVWTGAKYANKSTDWGRLILPKSDTEFYLCPNCYRAFICFMEEYNHAE